MKWKSPRCGQACWDEIKRHVDEREKIVVALVNMTRDRDEWREQHENLLAMYRATVGNPIAWMNREHIEAYAGGRKDGIAWASYAQSKFFSVPVYSAVPQRSADEVQRLRSALESIADWRNVNISGEYEHGLRDIIRSIIDCAVDALGAHQVRRPAPQTVKEPAERCLTCGRSDAEYKNCDWTCNDPWHADAHLRKKSLSLTRPAPSKPIPEPLHLIDDAGGGP